MVDIKNLQTIRGNSLDHCMIDSSCVANFCSRLFQLPPDFENGIGVLVLSVYLSILHECRSFSMILFTNSFPLSDWNILGTPKYGKNVDFKH